MTLKREERRHLMSDAESLDAIFGREIFRENIDSSFTSDSCNKIDVAEKTPHFGANLKRSPHSEEKGKCVMTLTTESSDRDGQVQDKRRRRSTKSETDIRPSKKIKTAPSQSSSCWDMATEEIFHLSSASLSASDASFKSTSSASLRVRKTKQRPDLSLYRNVLHKSKKGYGSPVNSPSGTPRKERTKRNNRIWGIMELCSWIGLKGYQSITGLYADMLKEPKNGRRGEHPLVEEVRLLKKQLTEMERRQAALACENEMLRDEIRRIVTKVDLLEIRQKESTCASVPPPPPPPPPLPPPTLDASRSAARGRGARCGSAPPRAAPRLAITPQDLANVKLRKAKENPFRGVLAKAGDAHRPLVTPQVLEATRARLGRMRPPLCLVNEKTQQLTDLEKCILQGASVSKFQRRTGRGASHSAEELRRNIRPYPPHLAASPSLAPLGQPAPRRHTLPLLTTSSATAPAAPSALLFELANGDKIASPGMKAR